MSLRRIKTVYCVAVISIALVLASAGDVVYWVTAVIVLSGALPMFRAVTYASWLKGSEKTENTLDRILAELTESGDHLATPSPHQVPPDHSERRRAGV